MDDLRVIETGSYAKVMPPSSFGSPPKLEWLSIKSLRIDPVYQREITLRGRKNIRRIVEGFDWSMFTPVIVAPAGSSLYAIVDGQHRATAAVLAGIERVPCAIIDGNRAAQARAFSAINGNVTRLHSVSVYHAALAAGHADAVRIDAICRRAGVMILRHPTQSTLLKPGETIASKVILKCAERYGEDATVAALKAIVSTGDGNPGLLNRDVIIGVTEVLADHKEWRADEKRLHKAFDTFSLDSILLEAKSCAARVKGTSVVDQFESQIVELLEPHFRGKAA